MRLKRYLAYLRDSVDKSLKEYLPPGKRKPQDLHKAMRYSVFSGGKRIRPILTIESCIACGGSLKGAMPIACAIELIHTYSLIHDDLPAMDDDDYRRGKPTCHKVFGEANAILAGDALLSLAFGIISKWARPELCARLTGELSDAIGPRGMVGGQALDMEFSKENAPELNRINTLKTARLFEISTKLGAIAALSPARYAKAMARFGRDFGMAFQIADDIHDNGPYIKVFGPGKARKSYENLMKRATGALKVFGRKAGRLKEIANNIIYGPNVK